MMSGGSMFLVYLGCVSMDPNDQSEGGLLFGIHFSKSLEWFLTWGTWLWVRSMASSIFQWAHQACKTSREVASSWPFFLQEKWINSLCWIGHDPQPCVSWLHENAIFKWHFGCNICNGNHLPSAKGAWLIQRINTGEDTTRLDILHSDKALVGKDRQRHKEPLGQLCKEEVGLSYSIKFTCTVPRLASCWSPKPIDPFIFFKDAIE